MNSAFPPDREAVFAAAPLPWITPAATASVTFDVDDTARVLFTRLIVRRNFEGFPFWVSLSPAACATLAARAHAHAEALGWSAGRSLADLTPAARGVLREHERLPERPAPAEAPGDAGRRAFKALFLAPDPATHALLGEVEHWTRVRILSGFAASAVMDAALEEVAAEDERASFSRATAWGFLTSDPAYVGSGLSFEAGLHLPGLVSGSQAEQIRRAAAAMGFVLEPLSLRDPGAAAAGFFRLATRGGIDASGPGLYSRFAATAAKLLGVDAAARARRRARDPGLFEDRAHRALGVLRDARRLEAAELASLVSWARVGVYEGFFPGDLLPRLEELRVRARPFHLAAAHASGFGPEPADPADGLRDEAIARAALARTLLTIP